MDKNVVCRTVTQKPRLPGFADRSPIKVSNEVAQIGLIAVSRFAQGQGVGSELVRGALNYALEAGATTMRVTTQSRNLAAQRLYNSCGFKQQTAVDVYHGWLKELRF